MSTEVIMLSKKFDVKKLDFPVFFTEKLDGVAGKFSGNATGVHDLPADVLSRQGEHIFSVVHIQRALQRLPKGHHIDGEFYIPGSAFKYISGLVRRHEAAPELQFFAYDYHVEDMAETYVERRQRLIEFMGLQLMGDSPVKSVIDFDEMTCSTPESLIQLVTSYMSVIKPNCEGVVIRPAKGKHSYYKAGKRSWGMQKLKRQATADLRVIAIESAIDKLTEKPLNMVGRIIVEFKGQRVGVGPGKMTHHERFEYFNKPKDFVGKIIEIAYMPDLTYDAMREPRFIQMRHDKTEESYD